MVSMGILSFAFAALRFAGSVADSCKRLPNQKFVAPHSEYAYFGPSQRFVCERDCSNSDANKAKASQPACESRPARMRGISCRNSAMLRRGSESWDSDSVG